MDRSSCWRANKELKNGESIDINNVPRVNAIFVATTRSGNVMSIYYKFKNLVSRSTIDKLLGDNWLIIPVNWWSIRRWMVIASDERNLIVGKELLKLQDNNRIQCSPSSSYTEMKNNKNKFKVCKRLKRIAGC